MRLWLRGNTIIPTSLCNYSLSVAFPTAIESTDTKERATKSSARPVLGFRWKNGRTSNTKMLDRPIQG